MHVWTILVLAVCTIGIWVAVFSLQQQDNVLTVAFLDVGQGDAIFVETPNGTQLLLDAGPDKSVLRALGKQLSFYDRSIDMIIASHPDLDHIGGFPAVLKRYDIDILMTPGIESDIGAYAEMMHIVEKQNVEHIIARRGRVHLDRQHGVYLDILFPDRDASGMEKNNGSIVAKLVYGNTSFLLTGDSSKAIEKYLLLIDGESLDTDVLKLGHHGSDTSSSLEFLGYTSPMYAIISAGEDNRHGHPHEEVLERLKQFDIAYLETSKEGTIVFESDGTEVIKK
jgi:competence protein ComEC